jgi:predicted site-specific integrase-resolvase
MAARSASYSDEALVALGPGAELIGVSRTTLRKYADDGLLPVFRTPTGQRRFRVGDLRALITPEPAKEAS